MKVATDAALAEAIAELHAGFRDLRDGNVATYIPELTKVDPDGFAVVACTADGRVIAVGDAEVPFTIQSVSKPAAFGLGLDAHGRAFVNARVGVEPTGDAFNSHIRLDEDSKRPHNPMVNAGAIAMAAMVPGATPTARLNTVLDTFEAYLGHRPNVDMAVFMSEKATGHRNRAIAHLMLNFGMLEGNIDEALDLYFQQCAILVTARDLATMAATFANHGTNPRTGAQALKREHVRDVLSVMASCGMYDYSGEWAYHVGLPAKSGVGGAIIAVVPGRFGLAVWSPRLDARGNSVRGIAVCRALSERFGLHMFDAGT